MHIKLVKIQGILSYKEETRVELSNGMNVFVGANGAGKSSFITAIQLAMTNNYRKMTQEKRKELLFSRSNHLNSPSYVEIVFDNVDRRLPVDDDTVCFRREFGMKKDRLAVNGKEVLDVGKYLQTAGFNNPYFIVKQGQITSVATGMDSKRLQILKDIAGLTVLEGDFRKIDAEKTGAERCWESVKSRVAEIRSRIEDLESEKTKLDKALALDADKRAIDYILQELEVKKLNQQISDLEKQLENIRLNGLRENENKKKRVAELQASTNAKQSELTQDKSDLSICAAKIKRVQEGLQALVQQNQQDEQKFHDCSKELNSLTQQHADMESKLNNIQSLLHQQQQKLVEEETKYEECLRLENETKAKWSKLNTEFQQLNEKFSRCHQFNTAAGRNEWIDNKLKELETERHQQQVSLDKASEHFDKVARIRREKEEEIQTLQKDLENISNEMNLIKDTKRNYDAAYRQRLSDVTALQSRISEKRERLDVENDKESKFYESVKNYARSRHVVGIPGVRQACHQLQNETDDIGYYGTILDCISCDESVQAAVQAAAGTKLFYHVVRDYKVGQNITRVFNQLQLPGEVNFLPLNRLKPKLADVEATSSIKPLIDLVKINYDEARPAVQFVFGRTLLCNNLEEATRTAKLHKLNCVTTEGDKVEWNGLLSGGYVDPGKSTIMAYGLWARSCDEVVKLEGELNEFTLKEEKLQRETHALVASLEKYKSRIERMQAKANEKMSTSRNIRHFLGDHIFSLEAERNAKDERQLRLDRLCVELNLLRKERDEDLHKPNDDEVNNWQSLRAQVKLELKNLKKLSAQCAEQQSKVLSLRSYINLNLKVQEEELQMCQYDDMELKKQELKNLEDCHEKGKLAIKAKKKQLDSLEDVERRLNERVQTRKEALQRDGDELERLLEKLSEEDPRITAGNSSLQDLRAKLKASNVAIGVVPANLNKFKDQTRSQLMKRLKRINLEAKEVSVVDQAKVNMCSQISTIREEIDQKMAELESQEKSLDDFRGKLDEKTVHILPQLFITLQQHFRRIFSTLVPDGNAMLVLYGEDLEFFELGEGQIVTEISYSGWTGLGIRASFTSKNIEGSLPSMQTLSGGQKSLIAVTLILAIQKIHPVPIYLLDEIDQALDPSYRASVAQYLRSCSDEAQFICTTFGREFVEKAQRHFAVTYRNTLSAIKLVTMAQSLDFVQSEESSMTQVSASEDDSSFRSL